VMAEPADIVAGVVEVVGVATEGSVVAQVLAVFLAIDGLPDGVNGLQDLSLNLQKSKIATNKCLRFINIRIYCKISCN